MKREYTRPVTEVMRLRSREHLTESTYVPIGGGGGFDAKRHQGDWEIEWEGTWSEADEEEAESIF